MGSQPKTRSEAPTAWPPGRAGGENVAESCGKQIDSLGSLCSASIPTLPWPVGLGARSFRADSFQRTDSFLPTGAASASFDPTPAERRRRIELIDLNTNTKVVYGCSNKCATRARWGGQPAGCG